MVDYIKAKIIDIDTLRLIALPSLEFIGQYSKTTGEINENILESAYNHCTIQIVTVVDKETGTENIHTYFRGSIHKLWNALNGILAPNYDKTSTYKGFNGNQFDVNAIYQMRDHLMYLFDCEAKQIVFENIEFGINTTPEWCPKEFIKGLLFYQGKQFQYKYDGDYAESVRQRLRLKIYNKSAQYGMNGNVLRVEIHIRKMIEIRSTGITTFADINPESLQKAKDILIEKFKSVVYYDYSIVKKRLSKKDIKKMAQYSNPRYWTEELKPNHRDREKKKLSAIIAKHSSNLHAQSLNSLHRKCVIINRPLQVAKCVINNTSYMALNLTHSNVSNSQYLN